MTAPTFFRTEPKASAVAPTAVTTRAVSSLPRILCVDDDERLLAGLALRLRRTFDVTTATSAVDALAKLDLSSPFAAVVTDMRMPLNDGTALLSAIRRVAPDTTRILLTGQADVASAIAAVNEGEVFRFLVKPIETPALVESLNAAVAKHREAVKHRDLVEEMAAGVLQLLAFSVSNHSPALGADLDRVRRQVNAVGAMTAPGSARSAELAAIGVHMAGMALPVEVLECWRSRLPMTAPDRELVGRAIGACRVIMQPIPAMKDACEALALAAPPEEGGWLDRAPLSASEAARLLFLVLHVEAAWLRGESLAEIERQLRHGAPNSDIALINALSLSLYGAAERGWRLSELRIGQRIAREVRLATGLLLLPAGHEVTDVTITMISALDFEAGNTVAYVLRG